MRCLTAILMLAWLVFPTVAVAEEKTEEKPEPQYDEFARSHWSLVKPIRVEAPKFEDPKDQAWVLNLVDSFVLAALKEAGLKPSPSADRPTLIRRLTFDLTGLPPTPAETRQFVEDKSPGAYEKLVDRLLASPRYGERWGQHWLDLVRYSESEGFEYDTHRPDAWRYRDYVIRAFNSDKPYDRFVTEQLAGDEFVIKNKDQQQEVLVAAGLHRLGPVRRNAGNAEVAFSRNEILTEMTDMVGLAFMGLTIGCARCHDHKFDPILQTDYYRLQAFLAATHDHDVPLSPAEAQSKWKSQDDAVEKEIKAINKALLKATGDEEYRLREKLKEVKRNRPHPLPSLFSVKNDFAKRTPIHLLHRGEEDSKGERLGMRVLGVLLEEGAPELDHKILRPKTELARWITAPEHPLTSRVMVNRIWLYHFGHGIVDTPNDFGVNGDAPSHPELLDRLAVEFVAQDWSIKAMHRLMVLSNTYRQSSESSHTKLASEKDPDNRLLWHFRPRRLDAEEIRDAMLAISGQLNLEIGGPSVIVPVDPELVKLLYKPDQWKVTDDTNQHLRRSIYLISKRNLRLPFMEVFDQPDLQISCFGRRRSTHAPQALELLNGELSNRLAIAFAARLKQEGGSDSRAQIQFAFDWVAGRPPTEKEQALAVDFLKTESLREFALAMFNLNTFLYVR